MIYLRILFTISIIFENMKISFDTSYDKLAILNVSQQWTSTEFFFRCKGIVSYQTTKSVQSNFGTCMAVYTIRTVAIAVFEG